ncbi:MAG: hypothetical protein KatS3mg032_1805 [Cyclobacteriaceae bacterium]|nr:MAG: hypothetical protein KatS3mg032_1805 [Cyclobacteriaceae bacterium]
MGRSHDHGDTEKDGKENNLKHAGVGAHSPENVVGNNVYQYLQRAFVFLPVCSCYPHINIRNIGLA